VAAKQPDFMSEKKEETNISDRFVKIKCLNDDV